jgi:DHA1 family bicyclomycin/chloramphenicol resistance-like MFS transporter
MLKSIGKGEFVALMAALMAVDVLAIDIMLPALPEIGNALGVADPNDRSLVLTAFLIGFGLPQLVFGPITDRFGRRTVILLGLAAYVGLSLAAAAAPSFALMLLFRFLQGTAASAVRVGFNAAVRDRYSGREMAEIMSLVLGVFLLVPIFCPSIGQLLLFVGPWQLIFVFMAAVATLFAVWTLIRLPETLAAENRRALSFAVVLEGFRIVFSNRRAFFYGIVGTFMYGIIVGTFSTSQQVFVEIYDLGAWYPVAFAMIAVVAAITSLFVSRIIRSIGMRRVGHTALSIVIAVSGVWTLFSLSGTPPLWLYYVMVVLMFPCIVSVFNTTGALAMEPLGEVAGTASSVFGAISTVGGAAFGLIIAQAYDGTLTPVFAGNCILGILGLSCIAIAEKGQLFGRDQSPVRAAPLEVPV